MSPPRTAAELRALVGAVPDPELPFVSIADLGILRDVAVDGTRIRVTITPTYSGCPAMAAIGQDIEAVLAAHGYDDVAVVTELAPAWTTDWMSAAGKQKLRDHGIAPPSHRADGPTPLTLSLRCPRCGSAHTRELAHFGSTSCKALWRCLDCREPFDAFKVH